MLLDTGPLVAFLNRRDQHHAWAKEQWGMLRPPLLTCEAVISEACFLLRDVAGAADVVLELMRREIVAPRFRLADDVSSVMDLMKRYAEVPMSFADACLVRLAEQHIGSAILTFDNDFRVYRRNRRDVIPTIMPPSPRKPAGRGRRPS